MLLVKGGFKRGGDSIIAKRSAMVELVGMQLRSRDESSGQAENEMGRNADKPR